jgi:hypothetical protein
MGAVDMAEQVQGGDSGSRPVVPANIEQEKQEWIAGDMYSLGGQEDGTWSVAATARRRRLFDEDDNGNADIDQFLELGGAHRYFDEFGPTYFETSVLARAHETRGPTLGLGEAIQHRPEWLPATLRLNGDGYLQWPEGDHFDPGGRVEWSLLGNASIGERFALARDLSTFLSLSVFGKLMSVEDADEYPFGLLDADIFTTYKDEHKIGCILSDSLTYRPWLDTEIGTRVSLTTNEDFNLVQPDHLRIRVGCRQFFRGLALGVKYEAIAFFEDKDRSEDRLRQTVGFDLLYDLWATPWDRLEVGCRVEQDISDGETNALFTIAWHWSNGRGYRDFAPNDIDFLALRKTRMFGNIDNSLKEGSRE